MVTGDWSQYVHVHVISFIETEACQFSQASWEPNDPKAARHVCKIYLGRPCRKQWFLNPSTRTCPALILSCHRPAFSNIGMCKQRLVSHYPEWLCYISLMVCRDTVPDQRNGMAWRQGCQRITFSTLAWFTQIQIKTQDVDREICSSDS